MRAPLGRSEAKARLCRRRVAGRPAQARGANVPSAPLRRSEKKPARVSSLRLFTVGHSTRTLEELVRLLHEHGIQQLVDVRHFPRSRRNPQFNREALELRLPEEGIRYVWLGEELGGFRTGGYERYANTPMFQAGIERLRALGARAVTAIMCAEIVWFRCHRRFIARRMAALGYRVTHVVHAGKPGYEEPLPLDLTQLSLAGQEESRRRASPAHSLDNSNMATASRSNKVLRGGLWATRLRADALCKRAPLGWLYR